MIGLLTVFQTYGQQAVIKVLDAKTGEPVPYAHVCFESLVDGQQKHGLTNDDGQVTNLANDRALVAISFVGYETLFDTIVPGESKILSFEPAIFNMNELVVTAQFTPQRVDKSIYKVKVIGAKEIEQKAASNLSELFSNELGIRINQDGALGSSMSIRGLSGENVKFLVNGVPVIGRLNGNIDLGQLNLSNVEHVEMIEGPMSVVYGSNALAGVVNIITKENKNTPFTASANAYVESVGTYNFSGSASVKQKNNIFGISGTRNFFGGYAENGFRSSSEDLVWDPKRQYIIDGYYIYDRDNLKFKYTSQFFDELLQNKGEIIQPHYARDSYFNTTRFNNSIDFSTKVGDKRYFKLLAAYSIYDRTKTTYFKNLHTLEENLTENDGDQDTTSFNSINIRTELSKSTTSSWYNYQAGLDVNVENGTGKRISDEKQSIGDYAAYFSLKLDPIPTLTIQPGMRLIYNTKYNAPLVYSLNVKWNLLENTNLRASYSRGFRAPSLKELYLFFVDVNHNIQGNPDLKAENSHNVVMAFNYLNEKGKANFGLNMDVFYNDIENIITIALVEGDLYSYINIDSYISKGGQAELFYNLYPQFKWKVGVVYTGRKNVLEGEQADLKKFLYSTDVNTSVTYSFQRIKTDLSVYYKFTGRLPQYYQTAPDEFIEGFIDSYNTMDITANKRLFKGNLKLSAGVKNLFDVKTLNATGGTSGGSVHGGSGSTLVGYGRSYFAALTWLFNKF